MTVQMFFMIIAAAIVVMYILRRIAGDIHPLRNTVLGMLVGIAALTVVNLFSPLSGITMPVSLLSLTGSAVLGIPGVTSMLLLQVITQL